MRVESSQVVESCEDDPIRAYGASRLVRRATPDGKLPRVTQAATPYRGVIRARGDLARSLGVRGVPLFGELRVGGGEVVETGEGALVGAVRAPVS